MLAENAKNMCSDCLADVDDEMEGNDATQNNDPAAKEGPAEAALQLPRLTVTEPRPVATPARAPVPSLVPVELRLDPEHDMRPVTIGQVRTELKRQAREANEPELTEAQIIEYWDTLRVALPAPAPVPAMSLPSRRGFCQSFSQRCSCCPSSGPPLAAGEDDSHMQGILSGDATAFPIVRDQISGVEPIREGQDEREGQVCGNKGEESKHRAARARTAFVAALAMTVPRESSWPCRSSAARMPKSHRSGTESSSPQAPRELLWKLMPREWHK